MTPSSLKIQSVASAIAKTLGDHAKGLKKALILSIPYAATLGGMATVIGTTTNPTGIGLIQETIGLTIGFTDWLKIGLPFTLILIPLFWLYMVKFFKVDKMPDMDIAIAHQQYKELGFWSKGEKYTAAIFLLCIFLWVTHSNLRGQFFPFATDETVAMLGGSMVMGNAFKDAGVAAWIAGKLTSLAGLNSVVIVIIVGIVTARVDYQCRGGGRLPAGARFCGHCHWRQPSGHDARLYAGL